MKRESQMNRYPGNVALGMLLAAAIAGGAAADTYYVSTAGDDSYDGLARTYESGTRGPKATIQAGVDAASDDDTVIVLDGTYTGTGNKQIVLPNDRVISVQSENCLLYTSPSPRD